MKLEMAVSRMASWAHAVERALHDSGPWTFRTSGGTTPAHRLIDREHAEIIFTGMVLPSQDYVVELLAGGDFVTMTTADFTQGSRITWKLSLKEALPAS